MVGQVGDRVRKALKGISECGGSRRTGSSVAESTHDVVTARGVKGPEIISD